MSDESILITPEELQKLRKQRKSIDPIIEQKFEKYSQRGDQVEIHYESKGRFSTPETLYFSDFKIEDVNNLTISKQEDILENVLVILNKRKNQETEFDVAMMTTEEFMETLVAIKLQFNTKFHTHHWQCKCQNDIDNESDRKTNETIVDLSNLQYRSIDEADKIFKQKFEEEFHKLTKEQFNEYLLRKYQNSPIDIDSWSIEKELQTVQVQEPFYYRDSATENIYGFRFNRIGDIVEAQKYIKKKYSGQIATIQKRPLPHGVPLVEAKQQKDTEIEDLKTKEAREVLLIARSFALITHNGKSIENINERFELYKNLSRETMFNLNDFLKKIEYGIYQEIDLVCPLCGETEKRLLQREFNPIELLPFDVDPQGKQGKSIGLDIYFGV